MEKTNSKYKNETIKTGMEKISWAYKNMPVLNLLEKEFINEKPFRGKKISMSIHVEAKTACLAKLFLKGGAEVYLTGCNPLSTQDDVAAALSQEGINVYCKYGATEIEYNADLKKVLEINPDIIIDDGGDLAFLLHTECKENIKDLIGGCEETTTGVSRLKILEKNNRLLYPVISVNDAQCKHLFDNRYGTGQSTLTAIMATTNLLIADKTIVIAGYGMCGKGIALRARGMGAKVIITEIDPVKSCEALMDGFKVFKMDEACKEGDIFITVTGCKDVITSRHYPYIKNGAILCNAGHFDVEINVEELEKSAVKKYEQRKNITGYVLSNGNTLNLLAKGRLVNLASGDGHPVEIMDMSFALQALCAKYFIEMTVKPENKVYFVPEEIDKRVADLLLRTKNINIDELTENQEKYLNSWEI